MKTDRDLLLEYASFRSENAFAELVNRHLGLVYSAAFRQVGGDAHLAADVSQRVFIDLAAKAGRISPDLVLAAWLLTGTRFAAAKVVRSEQRRRVYEAQAAQTMNNDASGASDGEWERVRPFLDEALAGLGQTDREAVVLRFFQDWSYRRIGDRLKIKEDTARVRVERALDRLAGLLRRRRIVCTADALGVALLGHAASASVPAGMAEAIATTACASAGSLAGSSLGVGGGISLFKAGGVFVVGSLIVGLLGLTFFELLRETGRLRDEVQSLQQQAARRAAASAKKEAPATAPETVATQVAARIAEGFIDRNFLGDTEYAATVARRHRRYAMANYRPVVDAMNLPSGEVRELKELIATRWLAREDAGDVLDRMPDVTEDMHRVVVAEVEAQFTRRIQDLLGADRYLEFVQNWEANREYQVNWQLFAEFWDVGESLEEEQKRGLSRLLAKRWNAIQAVRQNNADPGLRDIADREVVEAAATFLTPGQRNFLQTWVERESHYARTFRDRDTVPNIP